MKGGFQTSAFRSDDRKQQSPCYPRAGMKSVFMQMKRFPRTSDGSIRGPHECSGLANLFKKLRTFEEQDQQKIMQTCQQDCGGSGWDLCFHDLDSSEVASLEILHSAACFITARAL